MKRINSILFCFLFVAIAIPNIYSQSTKGNGDVIKQERKVPAFKGIIATGSFELFIKQGDEQKVVIEADRNLHNLFSVNVRREILDLQILGDIKKAEALKVHVTLVNFNHLIALEAVDIKTDTTVVTDDINIFISGISTIKLNVSAKFIDFEISDGAYAYLLGNADRFDAHVTDESELNAFSLKAKSCNIKLSGYSDAKLHVVEEMKMRVTGEGNLIYKGNPNISDRIYSGSGFIIRRKND